MPGRIRTNTRVREPAPGPHAGGRCGGLGRVAGILLTAILATGCAHSPPDDPRDPLEGVNRKIYAFNDTVDDYTTKPLTKGYRRITPPPVEQGVSNFFANLLYPTTIINQFLQLKPVEGSRDLLRFLTNSTLGVAGLFDVATRLNLPADDEDFAQTLGYWGVGQGAYIMLPLLGPSTGRGIVGHVGDAFTNPINYIEDDAVRYGLHAAYLFNLRASLLPFERNIENAFDEYLFIRTLYLENRREKVHDGETPQRENARTDAS